MKKIGIYLCALWACGLMACSDDNEIGYVEPWEDEYVLPQGKSDADDRIVAFYEQYNRYILYDYTYLDIRYELNDFVNIFDFELPDPQYVGDMLDFLDEIWFDFYSDEFKQKYLPLKIMLAKSFPDAYYGYEYEYRCFVGSSCVGIGYCRNELREFTGEEKLTFMQDLQANLWANYMDILDIPEEFFEISSYTSAADTDPESANYSRARGFVEQYYFGSDPSKWYTFSDYYTGEIEKESDLKSYIIGMVLRSSEDWAEDLKWPLVKKKYDLLRNWLQETYGFDLQKIGDKTFE